MSKNLRLEVLLAAVDRVTGPLKKITKSSQGTAAAIKASRDEMRRLESSGRDLRKLRVATAEIRQVSRAAERATQTQREWNNRLDKTKTRYDQQKVQLRDARQNYNRLADAIQDGKGKGEEFTRQLELARIRLSAVSSETAKTKNLLERNKRKLQETTREVERLDQRKQRLGGTMDKYRQRLKDAGIDTTRLGQSSRKLNQQISDQTRQFQRQQAALDQLNRQKERQVKINQQLQKTNQIAGSMMGTGAGMSAAGAAAGYAGARLMAPGIELEKQLSELQAITRLSKESAEFQALAQQSRELGGSTQFDAAQVAAGQTFLARAGFSANAIQASMGDMLAMAIANNTELAKTADITSNISSAFKIDAEVEGNITRVADVLSGTAARANVNLEMLGETMKYLGGAEDLNLTLEQAAAMSGILGNIGIQGSMAGTTLRAMMNRLTGPTGKAAEVIDELGINVTDAQGNIRDLPTLLKEISEATSGMGNAARKNALQTIFGAEAGSGMAELVSGMASGQLAGLIGELESLQGENARMAKVMADNTAGDLAGLASAWQAVGDSIFTTNNGPIRQTIQSITGVLQQVNVWVQKNPELTAIIIKWGAAIAGVLVVGGTLLMFLGMILKPLGLVIFAVKTLAVVMMGVTWPVLAVVAAIAALAAGAYLVYSNWDKISSWFKSFIDGFSQAWEGGFSGVLAWTLELFGKLGKIFLDFSPIGLLYKGIAAVLSWFGVDLPSSFTEAGGNLISGLIGGITGKMTELKTRVKDMAGNVTGWFKEALGIKSPSRVFASHGQDTLAGYEMGIDDQENHTLNRVKDFAKKTAAAGAGIVMSGALAADQGIQFDTRAPMSASAAVSAPAAGDTIHIHINASAASAADIAREVERVLHQRDMEKQRRSRASLIDRD